MNKYFRCLILLAFFASSSFASEIMIAPLAVYDGNGDKISAPSNPSEELHREFKTHWFEGLINFHCLDQSRTMVPVTIIDANKICVKESADYLIYGYIKKNENSWQAEIKLFSYSEKKIIREFFASDGIDHYERMLSVLSGNILCGIEEVTGLDQDKLIEEKTRPMEFRIPASIFYWNPVDNGWGKTILGMAGLNTGFELYPAQSLKIRNSKLFDYSVRFNLAWEIAKNKKNTYPLLMNTIEMVLPFLVHVHFDDSNSLYGGTGFGYEIEMMKIKPKYEKEQFMYQGIFLIEGVFGYEYRLNDSVNLFTELVVDKHLSDEGFIAVKSCLGASFRILNKKKGNQNEAI